MGVRLLGDRVGMRIATRRRTLAHLVEVRSLGLLGLARLDALANDGELVRGAAVGGIVVGGDLELFLGLVEELRLDVLSGLSWCVRLAWMRAFSRVIL